MKKYNKEQAQAIKKAQTEMKNVYLTVEAIADEFNRQHLSNTDVNLSRAAMQANEAVKTFYRLLANTALPLEVVQSVYPSFPVIIENQK